MNFVEQCKAIDSHKLKLNDSDLVYTSIKHDGVYLQIHKKGDNVKIYLSSGRELISASIKKLILKRILDEDVIIECEYVIDNDRSKADQEIKALIKNSSLVHTGVIWIFDIINNDIFVDRIMNEFSSPTKKDNQFISRVNMEDSRMIKMVRHNLLDIGYSVSLLDKYVALGDEGLILKYPDHKQESGKKSKRAIKLKPLKIADLRVVEANDNGFLHLVDENGLTAKVRVSIDVLCMAKVGDIVEISYDFIGKAYNQAIFREIRFDKESL